MKIFSVILPAFLHPLLPSKQHRRFAVAGLITLFATPAVFANECESYSELKEMLGEDYYFLTELDTPEVWRTRSDETTWEVPEYLLDAKTIDAITASMPRGYGSRHRCLGTGIDSRQKITEFKLEQVELLRSLNGDLLLTAFESNLDKSKVAAATIQLPVSTNWLVSSTERDGMEPARHLRSINHRVRRGNYLVEIETSIEAVGDVTTFTQRFYVAGLLAEWVVWAIDT